MPVESYTVGPRIRTYVRFPPLEAFRAVIPADRIEPEHAFEPKPLLREDEAADSGRCQALENADSGTDCTLISRAPQPPWRRAPRTPRGQRPCLRAPNRPLPPPQVAPKSDWIGSGRWRPWLRSR